MIPRESFEFQYAGANYRVTTDFLVSKNGEVPIWSLWRDGMGLTSIHSAPNEPREEVEIRFARWLDDHLAEFTYRGLTYQIVHTATPEGMRERRPEVPPAFWYITQGAKYITQFYAGAERDWDHAKRLLIDYLNAHPAS